jgi:aromatic-L-amino-acid decarboxylase
LLAAAVAKAKVTTGAGASSARRDRMVVYCSDQTHAIVQKACMVLGIGHLRQIATTASNNWSLPAEALAAAIAADRLGDGLEPVACVATLGSTTSCAFDNVPEIAAVCRAEGLWLHIDAAYVFQTSPPRTCFCWGLPRCETIPV